MTTGVVTRPGGIEIPYGVAGDGPRRLVFGHSLLGRGIAAGPGAGLLGPLLEAGWAVATPDQRNHGDATVVDRLDDLALSELGADLLAVADDLGWDTCWLGGGSMGATSIPPTDDPVALLRAATAALETCATQMEAERAPITCERCGATATGVRANPSGDWTLEPCGHGGVAPTG